MPQIICYPVGNGDTTLVEHADKRLILVDYCDRLQDEDSDDNRIDLPAELRRFLKEREKDAFDAVAFTHADADHLARCDQFFYFEHASEYQGKDRTRIKELWVPACMVLEEGLTDCARVVRQEARHRLRKGGGIRIFSDPCQLDEWFESEGIDPKSRQHLISHAGSLVPGYGFDAGGVEIFIHSPYSFRFEKDEEDRNNGSLVLHWTFREGGVDTRYWLPGDAEHPAWSDIVLKTESKGRPERLDFDVFRTAHHCSASALGPDPGEKKTAPLEEIDRLFKRGKEGCLIIASSCPLTRETPPPHPQAAAYYKEIAQEKGGEFLVTMEYPSVDDPKPLVIEISDRGARVKKTAAAVASVGSASILVRPSPRFG